MTTWTMWTWILGTVAAGTLVGLASRPRPEWYARLRKPSWTPPAWVFGPVWTLLYALMGYAAWRVASRASRDSAALALFFVQLALNLAWSPLFFGMQNVGAALVDVVALWATLVAMTVVYARHDALAAALTAPYLAWVSFAAALTGAIYRSNAV